MEKILSIAPKLNFQAAEQNNAHLDPKVFGEKVGIITSLFGCWHKDLSRPFVKGKTAYRSCLDCGSRKRFDTQTFKTLDGFYHPPIVRKIEC